MKEVIPPVPALVRWSCDAKGCSATVRRTADVGEAPPKDWYLFTGGRECDTRQEIVLCGACRRDLFRGGPL